MNKIKLTEILRLHTLYLQGASLSRADLSGADLSRADLSGASLPYPIYQAYLGQYHISTNMGYIRIGCKYLLVSEWLLVTEKQATEYGLAGKHYSEYMDFIKWYAKKPISRDEV